MPSQHRYPTIRLSSKNYEQLPKPTGAAANTALDRYFWLIEVEKSKLSEAEFNLLCDACNGWATSLEIPETLASGLLVQIDDAIMLEELDKKWKVDGQVLISKLAALSPLESFALIEAIEKFWR